jgi:hypothetical protein
MSFRAGQKPRSGAIATDGEAHDSLRPQPIWRVDGAIILAQDLEPGDSI